MNDKEIKRELAAHKRYKMKCRFCEEEYWPKKGHECPSIFIHRLNEKEIVILGTKLDLQWFNGNILIGDGS